MHQTFQKPPKGSYRRERTQKRLAVESEEDRNKAIVRKRDRKCRWPFCDCAKFRERLEVAHVVSKSLGGSNDPSNLILLCVSKHQGRPSLHSGDLAVAPQTSAGTNGPCDFKAQDDKGRWHVVASERYVGVSETRGA
jgi:5-methylcytosine-specific restriction endonuclease McrA